MNKQTRRLKAVELCLAAVLMLGVSVSRADEAGATTEELLEKIKRLEQRVAELEGKPAPISVPSAEIPERTLEFLGQTELSGYVSASYLYDFSKPANSSTTPGSEVPLRTFDRQHNEFMLNKLKLALENPVSAGDKWDAGFRADLIVGQDADVIQSVGLFDDADGEYVDLQQAYVQVNVPVGNGLVVKLGKMVTLMGVEVIEEVANPNWSEGNQFLLVENFTSTGALLSYRWNDKLDTQLMVYNGWDQVKDLNNAKSFMGRLGISPDDKTVLGIVGYAGAEQADDTANLRSGVNVVFNRKLTDNLTMWLQGDYGHEENVPIAGAGRNSEWWAGGAWLLYQWNDRVGVAFRGDYLKDVDGTRTGVADDVELWSATLTLNLQPVANLQVRPELRYDRASGEPDVFAGAEERVTLGMGVAYLF